jgi:hypothetical protein
LIRPRPPRFFLVCLAGSMEKLMPGKVDALLISESSARMEVLFPLGIIR